MITWGVETLLATTLLMLAVLLLRNPVRRAFGPAIAYALWALPVLRLVLPPLPGDWRLSSILSPMIEQSMTEGVTFGVLNADRVPESVTRHAIATVDLTVAAEPIRMALVPPVATPDGPSWLLLALILWAVGAAIFIAYHLITYERFCRRLDRQARRRSRIASDRLEVIETDGTCGPLAFGIWRKVVAFPSDFTERYDEDERELALAHEMAHHARGDLIANWVALVVLALHWFNPIAWRAFRAFRADQEMACDAMVLAGRNAAFAHAYGRAIVKSAHGGAVSAACHLHTINELKGRLKMLSIGKKSRARIAAGSVGVLALTVAALGITASGTQAAERLRVNVRDSIGVELPIMPRLAPLAPLAPLASDAVQAPSAPLPAPAAIPIPPSDTAPQAAPAAPLPPIPPVAPVAPVAPGTKVERDVFIVKGDDGKIRRHVRIIMRDKDGKIVTENVHGAGDGPDLAELHGIAGDIPEVIDGKCQGGQGDKGNMVWHDKKNGKHRIIICRNRIERLASEAALSHADAARSQAEASRSQAEAARSQAEASISQARAAQIERNALRSALDGLRAARASMARKGSAGSEALKAMDEAIAEVEGDLAKVN